MDTIGSTHSKDAYVGEELLKNGERRPATTGSSFRLKAPDVQVMRL
jgi:hypothetical protein